METKTSFDKEPEPFLESAPPHWAARGLAYLLILLFLTAMAASVTVHIPETVSGPFVLVPIHGTDPVRSLDNGIISEVRVAEGQPVSKGNALFIIQSQRIGDRSSELGTLQAQRRGAEERLINTRRKYESESLADQQEEKRLKGRIDYLIRMIDLKKKEQVLTKEVADSYEKLYKSGISNRAEYASKQLDASKIALELQQLETELTETKNAVGKLKHESEAKLAESKSLEQIVKDEMEIAGIRTETLKKELIHSRGDEVTVPAPCSGTVLRLQIKAPGAVVQEGEALCELACSGEKLIAQMSVPQSGVAKIKQGQGVKLLYDAFPYQRYGVRFGKVRWVSPASVAEKDGAVFPIFIDLQDEMLLIKGQRRSFMPGMGGRAQVVVDKRSLISYAFAPIRQLKEMLAKPPEK
jgi:membrane fusion protein